MAPDFEIDHFVDDELVGIKNDQPLVTFSEAGYYRVKLLWAEHAGNSGLLLTWRRPGDESLVQIDPADLHAVHPGAPVPVAVQVGLALRASLALLASLCSASSQLCLHPQVSCTQAAALVTDRRLPKLKVSTCCVC